jgi:hypothetical protein
MRLGAGGPGRRGLGDGYADNAAHADLVTGTSVCEQHVGRSGRGRDRGEGGRAGGAGDRYWLVRPAGEVADGARVAESEFDSRRCALRWPNVECPAHPHGRAGTVCVNRRRRRTYQPVCAGRTTKLSRPNSYQLAPRGHSWRRGVIDDLARFHLGRRAGVRRCGVVGRRSWRSSASAAGKQSQRGESDRERPSIVRRPCEDRRGRTSQATTYVRIPGCRPCKLRTTAWWPSSMRHGSPSNRRCYSRPSCLDWTIGHRAAPALSGYRR